MASFGRLQKFKKTGVGILLLGAFAAPQAGLPQSAFEPLVSTEQQRLIVDEIHEEQSRNGSFSPALIEPWTALALLYEEDGSRALATAAIAQGRQVVRVNYGLHSLKEASLIRLEVRNERARGDAEAAWDLEQDLLRLIRRHPNDLRTVPILRQIAEERMHLLSRYRAGEFPPEIVLGCYYDRHPRGPRNGDGGGECRAGSRDDLIRSLLAEAQSYYAEAIGVMVRNRRYSSDELQELEARLIRTCYSASDYSAGKRSYRRLMAYNAANSAAWLTRIETFVEMTDWDLMFSQHSGTETLGGLVEAYERAYALLEQKGVERASIDRIFSPEIPVVLPAFLPNPLAPDESSDSTGYIDVAFDITKYGHGEHVKILAASENATRADKRDLVQLIKGNLFRPRVTNGRVGEASRVVVRYHLQDRPAAD